MTEPTHVLRSSRDSRSICGIKDPLPVVVERFVQAHVNGRAERGLSFPICEECQR